MISIMAGLDVESPSRFESRENFESGGLFQSFKVGAVLASGAYVSLQGGSVRNLDFRSFSWEHEPYFAIRVSGRPNSVIREYSAVVG